MSKLSIALMLHYVILGPYAGRVVDTYNKKHLMILCDFLRAILILLMIFCKSYILSLVIFCSLV